jgi:hypothetical protein
MVNAMLALLLVKAYTDLGRRFLTGMGARIGIPLWVSLPCVAVSVVALGAVAAGVAGLSATRGYLTRQTDSSLLACAGGAMVQRLVDWPASGPAASD